MNEAPNEQDAEPIMDECDDGASDPSDSNTNSSNDKESFKPGDIVWARHGRFWYPATVISPTEVADSLKNFFSVCNSIIFNRNSSKQVSLFLECWFFFFKRVFTADQFYPARVISPTEVADSLKNFFSGNSNKAMS